MLPHYGTPGAAGLDLRACLDAPLDPASRATASWCPSGIAIHIGDPGYAAIDPAALGPGREARHRARQPRRPDRLRLPGAGIHLGLEPRPGGVHHPADGPHRAAGGGAGAAGRIQRGRGIRRLEPRRRRLRQHGQEADGNCRHPAQAGIQVPSPTSRPRWCGPSSRRRCPRPRCAPPRRRPNPARSTSVRFAASHWCTDETSDRFLLRHEAVAGVEDLRRRPGARPFRISMIAAAAILAWLFAMLPDFGIAAPTASHRPARGCPEPSSTPCCASRRRTSDCWW